MTRARYDGFAGWYDDYQAGRMREVTELAESLTRALLPAGSGWALDLGCGTGRHYQTISAAGYDVVGVDLSGDQLLRTSNRGEVAVQGDAAVLPFRAAMFQAVVTVMTATDLEDLATALVDARRVTAEKGTLVLVMAHPCFGGVFEEGHPDGSVAVSPGYREHRWYDNHPRLGDGIRSRVGTMNVPLPALLNAVAHAGWHLERTEEDSRSSHVPSLLGIRGRAVD